jgi:hypothetical protein
MIESQNKILAIIWKMFHDRSSPRSTHAELLPVHDHDKEVLWREWRDVEANFDRVVIVPFYVAWKGPWNLPVPCIGVPNQQIGSLDFDSDSMSTPLWDCKLVNIAECCTGYLWPPTASSKDLSLLSQQCTYLHDSLRTWPKSITRKTFRTSIPIHRELVRDEDLPSYDRKWSPWEYFGVLEWSHANDGTKTSEAAMELLAMAEIFTFENGTIQVSLGGSDDWE